MCACIVFDLCATVDTNRVHDSISPTPIVATGKELDLVECEAGFLSQLFIVLVDFSCCFILQDLEGIV
jgi:hypothetical protein